MKDQNRAATTGVATSDKGYYPLEADNLDIARGGAEAVAGGRFRLTPAGRQALAEMDHDRIQLLDIEPDQDVSSYDLSVWEPV